MEPLLTCEEVERIFRWPQGRAKRLAKSGELPAVLLPPDEEIRFTREDVELLTTSLYGATRASHELHGLTTTAKYLRVPAAWLRDMAAAKRLPHYFLDGPKTTVLLFDREVVSRVMRKREVETGKWGMEAFDE